MSRARVTFGVVRRCPPGECDPGCNCDLPIVLVDVDELTLGELVGFAAYGSPEQSAEAVAWLAELEPPPCECGGRCSACDPDTQLDLAAELAAGRRDR